MPPTPLIVSSKRSEAAIAGPLRTPITPSGWACAMCIPSAASTFGFSNTPASIIGLAPPGPSSAG